MTEKISKRLYIEDKKVVYEQSSKDKWSIDIDKLKFIGEYTTSAGPMADDYFFVFAEKSDVWWQAPTLAVDHEQFWKQLGQKLNCEIAPNLFASTVWATNVIYPKKLEGQELFKIVKTDTKPKTFWQKVFGSGNGERLELTDEVKKLFQLKKPMPPGVCK